MNNTGGSKNVIVPLERDVLRKRFREAEPFPFVAIDGFLEPEFALEVARSYPTYQQAAKIGKSFQAVHEQRKTQVTDYALFPAPVQKLADALAAPELMATLSDIAGLPPLLWDDTFIGGGMHQTASTGLLDVHVDFNQHRINKNYRRLNLLLYLNPVWKEEWGGKLELWNKDVSVCHHSFAPVFNRCVIFQTSEFSFHGVTATHCPEDVSRKSFAIYYYTREAPPGWEGRFHTTIFKARPDEYLKKHVLMPAAKLEQQVQGGIQAAKRVIKKLVGRE
jgi:2-oxoglutarate-Fe(II)-dependent oxygenase superfamily protein